MTFESLVHSEKFVSELLTKTIGQLGLDRPKAIRRVDCRGGVTNTAKALAAAHLKANFASEATMLIALGVPYLRLEGESVTAVLPDFAIVAPRLDGSRTVGSWLIMGDAKDYERIRSRIDDNRMLKGFLQVALGAESASSWSQLPKGMVVHRCGALAVPRNAFLQPEAVVEELDDHRAEVRGRALERLDEKKKFGDDHPTEDELAGYVAHLVATFNPASCASCNLFSYCRDELRASTTPTDLLIEVGIAPSLRPLLAGIVDGTGVVGQAPAAVVHQVTATLEGQPVRLARKRADPCGLPGAIIVVIAKSDSAALGIHGIAVRLGDGPWERRIFLEPQAPTARRGAMALIGKAIATARDAKALPIHLLAPDGATADVLVSAADSVAGVELSRMRWQRDLDMGREALTFDGTPATLADPLTEHERLAVAFLLEEDRSRALATRTPIVELRKVLASHLVPGGPTIDAFRLDYLVHWASAIEPLAHRQVSDEIAELPHTPGARLSNAESDAIHTAHRSRGDDPAHYRALVEAALAYKIETAERALAVLEGLPVSVLRDIYELIEWQSQEVWWRRVSLQALDLVRFGRTTVFWRNVQVDLMDKDQACALQLAYLADYSYASDRALDAGVAELSLATVVALDPPRLEVASRRFGDGTKAVALHLNAEPLVERPTTTVKIQAGSFKFGQFSAGPLTKDDDPGLVWSPTVPLNLAVGDELVLANVEWFGGLQRTGHEFTVVRPPVDELSAPKASCAPTSYIAEPDKHRWCCRPHSAAEAETADYLAGQRAAGKMNPEAWPPLVDEERFDVGGDAPPEFADTAPFDHLTPDDLGD
ncbi:hypothetical protein [Parafrankia discariae]|uniref:hypothetical protein n=1 Tax=Parafrankia discariae TaxID=365528 RepID=UPI0003A74283|nr:hypothetical protein [Parafrankia discariae]